VEHETAKKRNRWAGQAEYDRENVDTISFKTKKGARGQLKKAALASGKSMNGFIRDALNDAVMEVIGEPMEIKKSEE
jgi:uncharacterized protein (DUF1778 family)